MAEKRLIERARLGAKAWNNWRYDVEGQADAEAWRADLSGASLSEVNLIGVDFRLSDLSSANFSNANLSRADLSRSNLQNANLTRADLSGANLTKADLRGAILTEAVLNETVLADLDLKTTSGLESCVHVAPSTLDLRTLQKSNPLPLRFLRGVGIPDKMTEYLPSLLGTAIQHYSCFISYSTKDQDLADRIYADLQNTGVRCWFAPHDMPIGGHILDEIDSAIRFRDKVLLILSDASVRADWVEHEVEAAFAEEHKRGKAVLIPIRVDDAVLDSNEPWAAKLRARNIGDFRRWHEHDNYHRAFLKLVRDLVIRASIESERR